MSPRDAFPKPKVSRSHYFITLARGEEMRCIAVRPWVAYSVAGLFPICGVFYFAASLIFVMQDDVVSAVFQRQQAMQQAYEDRIADMRAQIDRVSSRQLLDQNSLEGKMHELISRQAKLETRSALVSCLAQSLGSDKARSTSSPLPLPVPRPTDLGAGRRAQIGVDTLPTGATSFARTDAAEQPAALRALGAAISGRPRPHAVEVLTGNGKARVERRQSNSLLDSYTRSIVGDEKLPVELRLGALNQSLDRIEAEQIGKVAAVADAARRKAQQMRAVISAAGLAPESLRAPKNANAVSGVGGPFVPLKLDPNGPLFEQAVLRVQKYVVEADRLIRVSKAVPLRRPLSASAQITSTFGRRSDPFNGRIANHTGLDFRQHYGAPVFATGAGQIVHAGYLGGYGKLVEIDHGNGLTSRYAHLSTIMVAKGERIRVGQRIGKIGSTGRSTGPHLHYEVRINDNPVNPARFIRAGRALPGA